MNATEFIARAWIPLAGYLLGSIPSGFLIGKLREGVDVRALGSGNIGAANVTRVIGPLAGIATLLLDTAKGLLAVWLAARFTGGSIGWMAVVALVAILGHMFPIWLGFRGGRGVATALGAFLLISCPAVLAALAIWLVVVLLWRYISLGSIAAAAALPLLTYLLYAPGHAPPLSVSLSTTAAAAMIIVKHRPNIRRLIAGTEGRFTLRRSP